MTEHWRHRFKMVLSKQSIFESSVSSVKCNLNKSGMLAPPHPAPPRGKTGCPALPREKQALPRPALQKLTKPAGRNGAKLTVDCTDYAHTFGLRMEKKMK